MESKTQSRGRCDCRLFFRMASLVVVFLILVGGVARVGTRSAEAERPKRQC